ncbi:acyl-CoA desaturase [Oleiphilus sp. HI0080]|uniref:fatty acid desaturase family protein n=2 Tax=Oleiphilus sp. HI0080 TaxID=1822255 RepID=UPI000ACB0BC5|nr:acyl-CoA desaturase [Oleiphilus sp. HI0080]
MSNSTMKRIDPVKLEQFAQQLEILKADTLKRIGEKDARYIRRLIGFQRLLDITSRILIPVAFLFFSGPMMYLLAAVGTIGLGVSKILDNMEIGHNVMHGQYDWMNDPNINSRKFDWDNAGDSDSWKRYHNHEHHTYTNVFGKDRDFGYGLLRLSNDLPWKPKNSWQILTYLNLSFLFEWGVAYHELAGERIFAGKKKKDSSLPISRLELRNAFFKKAGKQIFKDYILYPLLFWPVALPVLVCSILANIIRNLWTSSIIFCGHFTEDAQVFYESDLENEARADWYYRQILGSSNIQGSKAFHILSGHLSCQIEHHLFPDIPAPHYRELAPKVEALCHEYEIPYNTGSFWHQYVTVVSRILKYSFPEPRQQAKA